MRPAIAAAECPDPGRMKTTTTTSGKVAAYEAGKTLTITRFDGSKVTYVINDKSSVPADLVIGKTVTILPLATTGPGEPGDERMLAAAGAVERVVAATEEVR